MRQAIITKFHGPTNTRCARISARAAADRIFVSYEYGNRDPHGIAAEALARKLEWYGTWVAGDMPDGTGNCYVMREFASDSERHRFRNKHIVRIEE